MVPGKTKQPEDPRHTATQHSGWMLTQERIHRSGSELLLAKTTTNPAAKLVTAATGPAEAFLPVATA